MELPGGIVRKRLERWEAGPPVRFLTFSCFRNLPLLHLPEVRSDLAAYLLRAKETCDFGLVAWALMPTHVHLIVRPSGRASVGDFLRSIKQPLAQRWLKRWRAEAHADAIRIGGECRFWQEGGGFDRNVRSHDELVREIEYVHANPVEAGLVRAATQWEWSSARWVAGQRGDEFGWGGRIALDDYGVAWPTKSYT